MPKPKYNNKTSWKNQYNEPDFRAGGGGGGGDTRRVSFKPNRHGGNNRKDSHKDWSQSLHAHLQDEDIDMGSTGGGGYSTGGHRTFHRKNFKGGRDGQPQQQYRSDSPAPSFVGGKRRLVDGPISWYRVTLPYGNKYDKASLLTLLMRELDPITLWPITWKTSGTVSTFYVDEFKVAEKLLKLDRTLQMPDGYRLIIRVHPGTPNIEVNGELKDKIKLVMSKRYTAATKALDLTKFHADPELQESFCALFKPAIFLAIVDIIADNIPELEAINLQDNNISVLYFLKKINEKLPNLKILHLTNNKVRSVTMLDPLIGLPLQELVLDGNPLCDRFKDKDTYISEVRKRFPKVIKLDGIELPPAISFDITTDAEVHFPSYKQTFLCDLNGEQIVRQFLEQYFLIFDTDNRQPLLQAYHEFAIFSLTMAYPYGQQQQKDKNSHWLNWYSTDNRNILRVNDPDRRGRLLKQGHLAVVSFLQEMPFTKHDIRSFTVDLTLFTPQMISLTITGMFKELKGNGNRTMPIRSFFRTLIIVPAGSGFCIINDALHVTNATDEQAKLAFKTPPIVVALPPPATLLNITTTGSPLPPPTPVNSPNSGGTSSSVLSSIGVVPDDAMKLQMIQAMSNQSGMNMEWSAKCLEETQWDFARATTVFAELQKQNVIPVEAFVK